MRGWLVAERWFFIQRVREKEKKGQQLQLLDYNSIGFYGKKTQRKHVGEFKFQLRLTSIYMTRHVTTQFNLLCNCD